MAARQVPMTVTCRRIMCHPLVESCLLWNLRIPGAEGQPDRKEHTSRRSPHYE